MYQFEEPYNEAPYDDLLEIFRRSFVDNFSLPALTDFSITSKRLYLS